LSERNFRTVTYNCSFTFFIGVQTSKVSVPTQTSTVYFSNKPDHRETETFDFYYDYCFVQNEYMLWITVHRSQNRPTQ
jgi:hypothetical protein